MDIAEGNLGPEAKYMVKFENGKLVVGAGYEGEDLGIDVAAKFKAMKFADALIDALEAYIPGDQKLYAAMLKTWVAEAVK